MADCLQQICWWEGCMKYKQKNSIAGFLPSMIEQGGGKIVAVSSLQGRFALPKGSACKLHRGQAIPCSDNFKIYNN